MRTFGLLAASICVAESLTVTSKDLPSAHSLMGFGEHIGTVYRQIDGEGAQSQFVLFLNVREAGYNDVESHRIAREEFFLSDADTQVVRDISPLCPMREKSVHRSLGV